MNPVDEKFREWTKGLDPLQARISVFSHIRDIPYAVVPEIMDYRHYQKIMKIGRGSCTSKHFLLQEMYRRLGLTVFYVGYPHSWGDIAGIMGEYSDRLKEMAVALPVTRHLACRVEIEGNPVLVDVTLDLPLKKAGFKVNAEWDGFSDMILPITPCGAEEWYSPAEAKLMKVNLDARFARFYPELNTFLEQMRRLYNYLLVID